MFGRDFRCFHFQIWDQTEGIGKKGKGGQLVNLDLPNVHFLPYMDIKGLCHTQPWPSYQVSWSGLTFWMSIFFHIWYINSGISK